MNGKSYLGNAISYPPELKEKGEITVMVSDEQNIWQSLQILLGTTPGERVHRFNYGCSIHQYAFEIMDITTETIMKELIEKAIILFEPRISLNKISFDIRQYDGVILIRLDFTIRQTNQRSNMVYPFYLSEGTDVIV